MPSSLASFLKAARSHRSVYLDVGANDGADALGVWPQVVYAWGERPPMSRQYELEVKTEGELKADREKELG